MKKLIIVTLFITLLIPTISFADATQVVSQSQQEIDIKIISDVENKLIGYYKETPLTMDLAFQLKEDTVKLLNMEDRLKSERLTRVILDAESLMRYMVITMMNKDMVDQGLSTTVTVKGLNNKIIVYTNPSFLQEMVCDWANTNLIFAKAFHFDKMMLTNGYKTWTFKVKK